MKSCVIIFMFMQQPDTETHTNTDEMITEPKWNSHRSLYFSSMNTSTKFYTSHIGLCLGVWMCKHTIKPCLHITKFSFYLKISVRYSVHNGWQTHSARHHWHNNGAIFLSKNKGQNFVMCERSLNGVRVLSDCGRVHKSWLLAVIKDKT